MKTKQKNQKEHGGNGEIDNHVHEPDGESVNGRFERGEWTLFRSIPTISQSSGVEPKRFRRLIAKELTDNALDAGGSCRVGELPNGGFYVEDDGPGIDGTPEEIARLFSFGRPLISSKVKRVPTRGAMGNGLRVVAGAVFASGGSLRVFTRGREFRLSPQVSGETRAESKPCKRNQGTRVEVRLGKSVPGDSDFLNWANQAIAAVGDRPIYSSKTSPYWYDSDSFFELLQAAGKRTVRNVLADFDGYHEDKIGKRLLDRIATSLGYEEAEKLLRLARANCERVPANRLVLLGKGLDGYHAKALGTLALEPGRGSVAAELPYTVEAWCDRPLDGNYVAILVNRTPVTGRVSIRREQEKADVAIFGCNLKHAFTVGRKPVDLTVNVQIPYMPITSNGKEPDLELFLSDIREVIEKAAQKCQRANRADEASKEGILPSRPRGRASDEANEEFDAKLEEFANRLKEIDSRHDFKIGARGWCYILENEHGLAKGDFDKAQRLITECRKNGLLPIDFTSEDDARCADNLEKCDTRNPEEYAVDLARSLHQWGAYSPGSFWDNQSVYIQMVVEKIDLKQLFLPVCQQYRVPIINARGWSDLNLRAGLMRRFQEHERNGRKPILLYCGDLDPVGLQISDLLTKHLEELAQAVGWSPDNLIIDRFGLNADFIKKHKLTWIDGLKTGSGNDLSDSNADFVQEYISTYGKRKVEANALVVRPEAGRQLCQEAVEKYLDMAAIATYEQSLLGQQQRVRRALPEAIKLVLRELESEKAG